MTQSVDRVAVVGEGDDSSTGEDAIPTGGDDAAAAESDATALMEAADEGIAAAVEAAGATLTGVEEADAVVTVGERAVAAAARVAADRSIPMLPVGIGRLGVARPNTSDAIEALLGGDWHVWSHPLLSVIVGPEERIRTRAALTVSLMTVKSARISEYAVSLSSDRRESFRGDGVVVATPLGSDGYARAAGAPALEPGTGLAVVPVAPFRIGRRRWITPEGVTLSVEREEEPVAVAADGVVQGEVLPHEPVRIIADDSFAVISPSAVSGNGASDWKNSNESSTE